MKVSLVARIYPYVFRRVVSAQLMRYYSRNEVRTILAKTKSLYKEILTRAADIGGNKNFFIDNIYLGAYVIALYKTIRDKVTLPQLEEMIENSLNQLDLLKKKMKKQDYLSEKYKDKIRKASLWCKTNEKAYPANWQVDLLDNGNKDELRFQITKCGLCHLCNAEGVFELISLLCRTDYITIGFSGCALERNETLANGNERCLFVITRK